MKLSDVINDLRNYEIYKMALYNATDAIAECNAEMTGIKSVNTDSEPIFGGGNKQEERIVCLIDRKERLKIDREINGRRVRRITRGLEALTDDERKVLNRFYIQPVTPCVGLLCEELCIEKSQVYRIKDRALRKFAISQYGHIEV